VSRRDDLNRFYEILSDLEGHIGGSRCLQDCTAKSGWPERGLYFFFEDGELREDQKNFRVVRVGTHAVTAKSKATLWSRLHIHRGNTDGRGNHRGSVFRDLVGGALLSLREDADDIRSSWRNSLVSDIGRNAEASLEREVSSHIGRMRFVWLGVNDVPSTKSDRAYLERNSIALLSNVNKPLIDAPSPHWLGLHSGKKRIVDSGLWNSNHVEEEYDPSFLDRFHAQPIALLTSQQQVTPPEFPASVLLFLST
jgi:hypothetical protein